MTCHQAVTLMEAAGVAAAVPGDLANGRRRAPPANASPGTLPTRRLPFASVSLIVIKDNAASAKLF